MSFFTLDAEIGLKLVLAENLVFNGRWLQQSLSSCESESFAALIFCHFLIEGVVLVFITGTNIQELYIDGLVQERRNSSALAMELRLPCTNPPIFKSSTPGQDGHHFGRRYLQMHFREWKVLYFG